MRAKVDLRVGQDVARLGCSIRENGSEVSRPILRFLHHAKNNALLDRCEIEYVESPIENRPEATEAFQSRCACFGVSHGSRASTAKAHAQ
jgi:hypothetical protein